MAESTPDSEKKPIADARPAVKRDERGRLLKGTAAPNQGSRVPLVKREFLARLRGEDYDEVYQAFMDLVRRREPDIVKRAVEYLAGKPTERVEVTAGTSPAFDVSRLTDDELTTLERVFEAASLRETEVDGEVVPTPVSVAVSGSKPRP